MATCLPYMYKEAQKENFIGAIVWLEHRGCHAIVGRMSTSSGHCFQALRAITTVHKEHIYSGIKAVLFFFTLPLSLLTLSCTRSRCSSYPEAHQCQPATLMRVNPKAILLCSAFSRSMRLLVRPSYKFESLRVYQERYLHQQV